MKNSREYSKKVQQLYRSLKRRFPKVEKVVYDEPVDALVYAIISENLSEAAAQSAIKKFADYFVDLNDLRVSPPKEIIEVLGDSAPVTTAIASTLTRVLKVIFDEYHKVSLEALKKIGKRPARGSSRKDGWRQPFRGRLLHAYLSAGPRHTADTDDDRVSKKQQTGSS